VVGPVDAGDLVRLGRHHDLVVVATGRESRARVFPRDPARSPYTTSQRTLCGGLFRGVEFSRPLGLSISVSPGAGEIFQSPFWSFEGEVSGLLFSAVPGSPLEALTRFPYDEDPKGFEALALRLLRDHAPSIADRLEPRQFRLTRPLDLLQGAITPTVRHGWEHLGEGRVAVAVGDAWVFNDPLTGQGANLGSHCASVLARWILDDLAYDERFCRGVEREMWRVRRACDGLDERRPAATASPCDGAVRGRCGGQGGGRRPGRQLQRPVGDVAGGGHAPANRRLPRPHPHATRGLTPLDGRPCRPEARLFPHRSRLVLREKPEGRAP
jgi:2-polyprenyl-6-methoxyphenol hydroxylase-like FAD-dependent oxidoreductase